MHTPESITRKIEAFIVEDLAAADPEDLEPNRNLMAEGILDSISIMRLIRHLETELQVQIPPRDLIPKHFITIDAMAQYLSALGASRPTPEQRQA